MCSGLRFQEHRSEEEKPWLSILAAPVTPMVLLVRLILPMSWNSTL
jgi:hypothetical protein